MPEFAKTTKSAVFSWPLLALGAVLPLAAIMYLATRCFEMDFVNEFSLTALIPIKLVTELF
ncbi:hypothetical protein [Dethiosulfatarculus sandiegensis]|uniref:Uncharacterized protein n=1 Tax=Dethiosulfatarculus sandiegensis TaxID=1429043 RepID=A0A0D2JRV3_9BACT|nr:hypothetical protein [Dethiosulfatarculus sandiegensis]KIX12245.1 hypothetical protein X474_19665 [Dethiosulfatarculus sandiegensis]